MYASEFVHTGVLGILSRSSHYVHDCNKNHNAMATGFQLTPHLSPTKVHFCLLGN